MTQTKSGRYIGGNLGYYTINRLELSKIMTVGQGYLVFVILAIFITKVNFYDLILQSRRDGMFIETRCATPS